MGAAVMDSVDEAQLRDLIPGVLAALVHRGADFATAEDAVQEALIRAFETWPNQPPGDPKGWLITTAWRRFLDLTRSDMARRDREERVFQEDVLSSVHSIDGLTQKAASGSATTKKHYVSFVVSDGDNVQWDLRGLQQYYGNADRGSFSVGYGISPSLVDLAPSVLRWYYENASSGVAQDQFIAGPSGGGYVYPSRMISDDLDRFVRRLNVYMGLADLRIAEILDDQDSFDRTDLWSQYLRQPNIDALFYFGADARGRIGWADNKPVVGQRDVLWAGVTDVYGREQALPDRKLVELGERAVPRDIYQVHGVQHLQRN